MQDEVFEVGDSGWLFLTKGSNRVLDVYSGIVESNKWVRHWADLLLARENKLSSNGIKYVHVCAPEKVAVYGKYLKTSPSFDLKNSPTFILQGQLKGKFSSGYINPIPYLREQSQSRKVYHQTDTHWNFIGAYCVYQLIMARLGLKQNVEVLNRPKKLANCIMDLGWKLDSPVKEEVYFHKHQDNVQRVWMNELVSFKEENKLDNAVGLHVGSSVKYLNSTPLHKAKVLIFGDSFSEYRPHLLTGILAETFEEVMFVWGLNIDYRIVESYKPDIVITEAAERFLPYQLPKDDVDYNSFARERISEYIKKVEIESQTQCQ